MMGKIFHDRGHDVLHCPLTLVHRTQALCRLDESIGGENPKLSQRSRGDDADKQKNSKHTYRFEILSIRFDNFDPFFIAKDHLGVFKKIFANYKQLSTVTVDIALRKRFFVNLRCAQWLRANEDEVDKQGETKQRIVSIGLSIRSVL